VNFLRVEKDMLKNALCGVKCLVRYESEYFVRGRKLRREVFSSV
jgi:hypothetical protein